MTRQQEEFTMVLASNLYPIWAQQGLQAAFDKIELWRACRYVDDENYPLLVQAVCRWCEERRASLGSAFEGGVRDT